MGATADRQQRAREMDARDPNGIEQRSITEWRVRSSTGHGYYTVTRIRNEWRCECEDFISTVEPCKHVYWVYLRFFPEGRLTPTPDELPTERRRSVQNNPAYDQAQMAEFEDFHRILRALCDTLAEEPGPRRRGRPAVPIEDVAFLAIQKVYTHRSMRFSQGYAESTGKLGFIRNVPKAFDFPSRFLRDPASEPILQRLIGLTALPLLSVESVIAIDSTGFSTEQFGPYNQEKHRTGRKHQFMKAHAAAGRETHAILAVDITEDTGKGSGDSSHFAPLVERVKALGFGIKEVLGDKAYLARANADAVEAIGAIPYIPFKRNCTGQSRGSAAYRRMAKRFILDAEDFDRHYHQRVQVESAFSALKRKHGETLSSRTPESLRNEALAKVLIYDIGVLIHEMFERKVSLDAFSSSRAQVRQDEDFPALA